MEIRRKAVKIIAGRKIVVAIIIHLCYNRYILDEGGNAMNVLKPGQYIIEPYTFRFGISGFKWTAVDLDGITESGTCIKKEKAERSARLWSNSCEGISV